MGTLKTIADGELRFETEAFGQKGDPAVLLVMGMMASMLWWPEEFCEELAATGLYVIRYDNRDTGRSSHWPPGNPTYTFVDMAEDTMRVLDGHAIESAHVVGMSMGGMLAQIAALANADRVRTLTIISSSPVGMDELWLPGMTPAYAEHAAKGESVDWSDRNAFMDYVAADCAMLAGTAHLHDAAAARALIEHDNQRAVSFHSATNHFLLVESGAPTPPATQITVPLLVIHGTVDPIFPIEHGEALADAAHGKLVRIAGGGHELHPADWSTMISAMSAHFRESE